MADTFAVKKTPFCHKCKPNEFCERYTKVIHPGMREKTSFPHLFLTVILLSSAHLLMDAPAAFGQQTAERGNSVVGIFNRLRGEINEARGGKPKKPQVSAPSTRPKVNRRIAGPVPRPRPHLVSDANSNFSNIAKSRKLGSSIGQRLSALAFAPTRPPKPVAGVKPRAKAVARNPRETIARKPLEKIAAVRPVLPKRTKKTRVAAPLVLTKVSSSAMRSSCPKRQLVGLTGVRIPQTVKLYPQANVQRTVGLATAKWVESVVQPAARKYFGSDIAQLRVAASFACRTRNGVKGAKISEHGYGNAIDISVFTLANGKDISVASGWKGKRAERQFLRDVNAGACRYFSTVLGPKADRHHQDHFHLDLGKHGKAGTYRLCK